MLHAIQSGDPAMMESEMSRLDATVDVVCALTADLSDGLNALAYAARSGSIQMYTAVLALMESKLSQTEVSGLVRDLATCSPSDDTYSVLESPSSSTWFTATVHLICIMAHNEDGLSRTLNVRAEAVDTF